MVSNLKGKSILTDNMDYCLICNKPKAATHHLLSGIANRRLSDSDRVVVPLCWEHHTGKKGIHTLREVEVLGKIIGQLAWEKHHILELLIKERLDKKGRKGLDWRNEWTEQFHKINDDARDAFRSRYGKSFL